MEDLLEALQNTTGVLAKNIDMAPLTPSELKENILEAQKGLIQAKNAGAYNDKDMKKLYSDLQDISKKEKMSLNEASGTVTLMVMQKMKNASKGAAISGKVGAELLHENTWKYYRESVKEIKQKGAFNALVASFTPYKGTFSINFSMKNRSFTEKLLGGRYLYSFGKAIKKKVKKKFRPKDENKFISLVNAFWINDQLSSEHSSNR